MTKISSSILAANLLDLKNEVINIDHAGIDYIHIDIMDGHYVPNITFGPNIVKEIKKITKKVLDVHLMITPVFDYIEDFIKAGSDIISFHPEADKKSSEIIKIIKDSNCKPGIAIHPKVKIQEIEEYLDLIDLVIVMTVNPGFGGQKFMHEQLEKISLLNNIRKEKNLNFEIEIDGGINKETANICKKEGADVLVAGTYFFKNSSEKYQDLILSLK